MITENPTNLAPDFYMPKNNNVFGMDGHLISPNKRFPSMEAIIYAINNIKGPLGEGEEAKVYKIDTAPDYTVRVSKSAPDIETLSTMIWEQKFIAQENIFEDRNYAQAIAYMGLDKDDATRAMVTINLYVPGFSMDIASAEEMDDDIGKAKKQLSDLIKEDKPEEAKILKEAIEILDIAENGRTPEEKAKKKQEKEEKKSRRALLRTITLTEAVANMPDQAIDKLYDDLHFLSSREYSIDVGGGGFFTNTGNILLSKKDNTFRIIDLQPFIRERVGIPRNHTKGFNTPLNLAHGLIPGMYDYREEHAKYPPLIDYRTEIIDKIIRGAQRAHLNDVGGYLKGNMDDMARFWTTQLRLLLIPEDRIESFVKEICSVKQENRYPLIKRNIPLVRVAGRSMNS